MKILVLNGAKSGDKESKRIHDIIVREIKNLNKDPVSLTLSDLRITYCMGCFECWTKTPGICRFNDDGRKVAKMFVQSDLVIFFTPVTFGGYSSELKRALDRIIGIILPYFMQREKETHHRLRYEKYPSLMGVGVLPDTDKESERIFKALVERNAKNFCPPKHISGIFFQGEKEKDIRKKTGLLLNALGVV